MRLLFLLALSLLPLACASSEKLSDQDYIKAMERQEQDDFNRTMTYQ